MWAVMVDHGQRIWRIEHFEEYKDAKKSYDEWVNAKTSNVGFYLAVVAEQVTREIE